MTISISPTQDATPLPQKQLFPILLILLAEAFMAESLYSYAGSMMVDLGMATDLDSSGFSAGLLTSSFYFCQFLSSFAWGRVSDIRGRRPVLLIGCAGSIITCLTFGLSTTFTMALISRSLCGLLNGNIGTVKTYLAEVTDSTNRVRAFGLVGLMWGFGSIIGAAAGGLGVQFAVKYPATFSPDSFFGKFPYSLPNIMSAVVMLISLILSYLYLVETKTNENEYKQIETQEMKELQTPYDTSIAEARDDEDLPPGFRVSLELQRQIMKSPKQALSWTQIFKDSRPRLVIILYGMIGFVYTILGTIFPLLLIAPSGGFQFNTDDIGINNAIGGVTAVAIQLLLYPRLANAWGLKKTLIIGVVLDIPLIALLPFLGGFSPASTGGSFPSWLFRTILYTVFIVHCFCGEIMFAAVMTFICNSVPNELLGSVNGLSQSLVGLLRGVGPFIGASLLQWTLSNGLGFPLNRHFVFILLAAIFIVVVVLSLRIPLSMNMPFEDKASVVAEHANASTKEHQSDEELGEIEGVRV